MKVVKPEMFFGEPGEAQVLQVFFIMETEEAALSLRIR